LNVENTTHNRYCAEFAKLIQSVEHALVILAAQTEEIVRLMGVSTRLLIAPAAAYPCLILSLNHFSTMKHARSSLNKEITGHGAPEEEEESLLFKSIITRI
jgi:hypothetical protein